MTQGSGSDGETRAAAGTTGGPTPAGAMPDSAQLAELLKGIDKTHVGAAMSKMISASIGDIAMVFARSPQHKHYTFADMEWMILPAVLSGQFHVVEAVHRESGFRAPVGVITWARVCEEAHRRLVEQPGRPIQLRPDEWTSGNIWWLVHVIGPPASLAQAIEHLRRDPLAGRAVHTYAASRDGDFRVAKLDESALAGKTSPA